MPHHNQENTLGKMGTMVSITAVVLGIMWAMIAVGGQSLYVGKATYAQDCQIEKETQRERDKMLVDIRINMERLVVKNGMKWKASL